MGRKAHRHKHRQTFMDVADTQSRPCCALIKTAFFRDLLTNIAIQAETLPNNVSIVDEIEDLFQALRIEGYSIRRDGDTIVVQDTDGSVVIDPQAMEIEGSICQAADMRSMK